MGNALVLLSRPLDYGTCMGIPNLYEVPFQILPDCARLSDQRLGRARRLIANKQVQTFPVLSAGQRNNDRKLKAHKNTQKDRLIAHGLETHAYLRASRSLQGALFSVMPVTVARLNISVRHIRAIVPALSPAPRDALTESPIPACRGLFRL